MSAPYNPSRDATAPGSLGETVKSDASALADTARHDFDELGNEVKQQVGSLQDEAKAQIADVADKAKSLATEQKDLLSEQIGGVVAAIDKVASELEGSDASSSGYVRMVADGARKLSSAIEDNDVDDLLGMAQDFGRKQPIAFMGAAALLGFAASRFVLASAQRRAAPASGNASDAITGTTSSYDGGGNGGL